MNAKGKSWFRGGQDRADAVPPAVNPAEPSCLEVVLMASLVFALHILMVCRVSNFWSVAAAWGDNEPYLKVVTIIENWRAPGTGITWHFWGFPYAIAGVSRLFSLPPLKALVAISILGSLATCAWVHRLYGGWVAAAFIVINYRWVYTSVEGGSEPLFMCLLYASFLAARSGKWNFAALLAALSTTVRPLGVLALFSFAVVLVGRRDFRRLASITLIGLAIGVSYVVPLWIVLGNPFANFVGYSPDWGPHGWPLTYPFGGIASSFVVSLPHLRWPNLVFFAVWLVVALAGGIAVWLPRRRREFARIPQEALFITVYVLFFVCYNYFGLVGDFPRFLIPVVPLLVFSLRGWIPHDRRVLWPAAILSALLASAAQVGFKNVFGFRLP